MAEYDYKAIGRKWQAEWKKHHLFEPGADPSKKKFFITVPIPYPSGSMHLGHMYTWTRADIYARFMRMRGYNVLFPQGFHFTGGPIIGMSEKVKLRDPDTIEAFKKQGVSESDLKKFAADPKALAEYFTISFRQDFENIGMSMDWDRTFITLSPHFSRFVSWQFNRLKALGLISEGKHPVVWCPKENTPLGDHDRTEGEGESPQRFTIIKFECGEYILPAATLRPETVFGVTNLWINETGKYIIAKTNGSEKWIVSKEAFEKLQNQRDSVESLGPIDIKEFLDKTAKNPITGEALPIFSEDFVDTGIGSGVVMSVPMHAPFDFYGIEKLTKKGHSIKAKEIIDVTGQANLVKDALKKFGESAEGLKEATKFVYKTEFNVGVMNKNAGELAGLAVKDADEKVSELLLNKNALDDMYELTGAVTCRCGAKGIVKLLEKQWFIRYSDKEWKTKTRRLIERMKLYPEELRLQLLNTLEWLEDKAAARNGGLGTPLPWDKEWVIEPLSDSTIYMAYYTIVKGLSKLAVKEITDDLLDYIFLSKTADLGDKKKVADELKKEFDYWYPLDMRVSAKELLQNHFIFFIMNHCAIFDEDKWPRGIAINGWLTVSGEKLSKSKGATLTIKRGLETYGADQLRMAASAGNGMDDVEWDPATIGAFDQRMSFFMELAGSKHVAGNKNEIIDGYLLSRMNRIIQSATENMESFRYGSALSQILFETYKEIKLYLELGGGDEKVIDEFLSVFSRLNHPIFPHVTEELNQKRGNKELLETSEWPTVREDAINEVLENEVGVLMNTVEDIRNVIKLIKKTPSRITIGISDKKKFELYNRVVEEAKRTKNTIDIRKALRTSDKLLDKLLKNPSKIPDRALDEKIENEVFIRSQDYLKKIFGAEVSIDRSSAEEKSTPGKPAIKIE